MKDKINYMEKEKEFGMKLKKVMTNKKCIDVQYVTKKKCFNYGK
jgi:hypothetical protein